MESLVPEERMGLRGRRDALDPPETQAPLGSWVRRASLEFQVFLATLDARAPRVRWDFLAFPEPMERKECGVCWESLDLEESGAPRVHGASGDPEAPLESLEQREHQVVMAPMGPLESGVSLDLRAPMDFLAPKDHQAPLGRMGCQDTQAREEKWDSKGRPAPLALQE